MQQDPPNDLIFDNAEDEAAYTLLPGYALGITTPEERRAVDALLARYPQLLAELAAYRSVSDGLLLETAPLQPPAGAWNGILAQIGDDAPALPATPPERPSTRLYQLFVAPRLRLSPVLAAVLAAVFLGVVGLLGAEVARLRSAQDALLAERDQQDIALTLMRARDVGWVRMNNPTEPEASPSFAWLVYSPEDQAGVILASDFPALEPNMTYQLWANGDAGRVSLGLFDVDASGVGSITFRLPDDLSQFRSMGITPEPAGGSPGPTSPAVVRLELQDFVDRLSRRS